VRVMLNVTIPRKARQKIRSKVISRFQELHRQNSYIQWRLVLLGIQGSAPPRLLTAKNILIVATLFLL